MSLKIKWPLFLSVKSSLFILKCSPYYYRQLSGGAEESHQKIMDNQSYAFLYIPYKIFCCDVPQLTVLQTWTFLFVGLWTFASGIKSVFN